MTNLPIDEQLALVGSKLSTFKDSDIVDELEKQSKKRSKVAVIFLLAVLADWILSFVIPILTGRAPLTIEATILSFVLIIFYMTFVSIEKLHHHLDMKTVRDWIDISEKIDNYKLEELRSREGVKISIELQKRTMDLRDEIIRELVDKGSTMFQIQGSSTAQRNDWTPMTESFVRIIREIDDQLTYREMKEQAMIILEEKLPTFRESIRALLKHMKSLEDRETKRDENILKIKSSISKIQSKVSRIENSKV